MLREFFVDEKVKYAFHLFGPTHFFCLLIVLLSLVFIFIYRDKISKMSKKQKNIILKTGVLIMLLNTIIYYVGLITFGIFNVKENLPLHLCFLSGYTFIYAILSEKHILLKYLFFLSFAGPLPAMIFPELTSTWDYYLFYEFFMSHHLFMILSFFAYFAYNVKIKLKDIIDLFIFANCFFIFIIIYNNIFGSNYFFSGNIPEFIVKLMPFLQRLNTIFVLETMTLIIFTLLYQLVRFRNKEYTKIEGK